MSSNRAHGEGVLTFRIEENSASTSTILWIVSQPIRSGYSGAYKYTDGTCESKCFHTGPNKRSLWYLNLLSDGRCQCCRLSLFLVETTYTDVRVNVEFGIPGCYISNSQFWESTVLHGGGRIDRTIPFEKIRNAYETLEHRGGLRIYCKITTYDSSAHKRESVFVSRELEALGHSMFKDFSSMMENGKLSDVDLVMGEQVIRAHKVVLAFRSPVFMAMFENKMQETLLNEVDIPDISFDVMQKLVTYIYTDKVENIEDTAEDLLAAAEKYQVEGLKYFCSEFLISKIKLENVIATSILGDLYHANYLKEQSLNFIIQQIENLEKMEGFHDLAASHPLLLKEILVHISKTKMK
ncbi:hypothetical protein QAD02_004143 [Eretmocerus hayati]|uniref:Uncharacterized protein n=1 Tax=Eretmocerus hayati TaxID=131215 RepID=A0ACC2NRN4_9HYME|nr:hypothetical protein QAD02_004143 [Eretmocerus hayati]